MSEASDDDLSERERTQRERARREWELWVEPTCEGGPNGEPAQPISHTGEVAHATLETIRKVLRLKSFEREDLRRRLPGAVRAGARVDLEPLLDRLHAAGIRATLRRRTDL